MKIAIFSDIHSNLEALTSVLEDMDKLRIDEKICLGDIVGYAANPFECLEKIRSLKCATLKGNHDEQVALEVTTEGYNEMAAAGIEYSKSQLNHEQVDYLRKLPYAKFDDERDITYVHSSLNDPHDWMYVTNIGEAFIHFQKQKSFVCFNGHTHVPCVFEFRSDRIIRHASKKMFKLRTRDSRYLVNVGSVGQPRDNNNRACYVTYNTDDGTLEYHRVRYPMIETQKKILMAQLPDLLAMRLEVGV